MGKEERKARRSIFSEARRQRKARRSIFSTDPDPSPQPARAKSCGYCHGQGGKHNRSGRVLGGTKCPQCGTRA
jgi:hypothetical protein